MKSIQIIVLAFALLISIPIAHAEGWDFNFFGIDSSDFEDRKVSHIIIGCLASFAVHEGGHWAAGKLVGMDPKFEWDNGLMVDAGAYDNKSDDKKALFHAGGFLAQAIVGVTLTAVPYTRHSDFSVGFTGFTAINSTLYAITDGTNSSGSDTQNLDRYGYNGRLVALSGGLLSGGLSIINLNKNQKRKNCDLIERK
jgi:hypothetical protein